MVDIMKTKAKMLIFTSFLETKSRGYFFSKNVKISNTVTKFDVEFK